MARYKQSHTFSQSLNNVKTLQDVIAQLEHTHKRLDDELLAIERTNQRKDSVFLTNKLEGNTEQVVAKRFGELDNSLRGSNVIQSTGTAITFSRSFTDVPLIAKLRCSGITTDDDGTTRYIDSVAVKISAETVSGFTATSDVDGATLYWVAWEDNNT